MSPRTYRFFQSAVLFGLGLFLIAKIASGKLIWYIHPRFIPLTFLAVAVLLGIGWTVFQEGRRTGPMKAGSGMEGETPEHGHGASPWRLAIVTIPLVIGVLIPAHPLTASAVPGKGITAAVPVTAGNKTINFSQAADARDILQWNGLFNSDTNPGSYLGQEANVIGFVYHDAHLQAGQFLVARFALVCCPADAFAVVMIVDWPAGATLQTNQWVKVKGPVQSAQLNGQTLPLIQATSVSPVDPPAVAYLYP